jgi:hypothetical protein
MKTYYVPGDDNGITYDIFTAADRGKYRSDKPTAFEIKVNKKDKPVGTAFDNWLRDLARSGSYPLVANPCYVAYTEKEIEQIKEANDRYDQRVKSFR